MIPAMCFEIVTKLSMQLTFYTYISYILGYIHTYIHNALWLTTHLVRQEVSILVCLTILCLLVQIYLQLSEEIFSVFTFT